METPPRRTIGRLWTFRSPGRSTRPLLRPIFLTIGVLQRTMIAETRKASMWYRYWYGI
ncbi:hypothetical protein [Microcoleus vaginatus]|uniref:hypothetical protein n=1 Tax=Microcoleus vaginatus TaxID=119532 RepID=UPI00403F1C3B